MKKWWYNIEIQMRGTNERTAEMDDDISAMLGFDLIDIDEREPYRLTAIFNSEYAPTTMNDMIRMVLEDCPTIHYIDMLYRKSCEPIPKRVTFWSDGKIQTYTTHIIYEEEE